MVGNNQHKYLPLPIEIYEEAKKLSPELGYNLILTALSKYAGDDWIPESNQTELSGLFDKFSQYLSVSPLKSTSIANGKKGGRPRKGETPEEAAERRGIQLTKKPKKTYFSYELKPKKPKQVINKNLKNLNIDAIVSSVDEDVLRVRGITSIPEVDIINNKEKLFSSSDPNIESNLGEKKEETINNSSLLEERKIFAPGELKAEDIDRIENLLFSQDWNGRVKSRYRQEKIGVWEPDEGIVAYCKSLKVQMGQAKLLDMWNVVINGDRERTGKLLKGLKSRFDIRPQECGPHFYRWVVELIIYIGFVPYKYRRDMEIVKSQVQNCLMDEGGKPVFGDGKGGETYKNDMMKVIPLQDAEIVWEVANCIKLRTITLNAGVLELYRLHAFEVDEAFAVLQDADTSDKEKRKALKLFHSLFGEKKCGLKFQGFLEEMLYAACPAWLKNHPEVDILN